MMKKIILITGGQRSGKSSYAERLALSLDSHPVYMATAHVWDDEFRERVRIHRERRGQQWTNIEEEWALSRHDVAHRVVLIDCCTLWATNYYYRQAMENKDQALPNVDAILDEMKTEFDRFVSQDATFIFITNEVGMGGTNTNAVQRRFTDLLGWFNQYVAARADEVILMVSGIKVQIK